LSVKTFMVEEVGDVEGGTLNTWLASVLWEHVLPAPGAADRAHLAKITTAAAAAKTMEESVAAANGAARDPTRMDVRRYLCLITMRCVQGVHCIIPALPCLA
jgi:hypothetical protein